MTLSEDEIMRYITGWDGAWGVRIAAGVLGGALLLVVLRRLAGRRAGALASVFGLVAGAGATLFALMPQRIVDVVISTPYDMRVRMVTGMTYTQALTAVAFTFLVLVAFHFSISISSSRSNQARIAQKLAILEERLRDLDGEGKGRAAPDGGEERIVSEGEVRDG
jgi:hypothetical protein